MTSLNFCAKMLCAVCAITALSACGLMDSARTRWSSTPTSDAQPAPAPITQATREAPWVPPPVAPTVAPLPEPTPIEPLTPIAVEPLRVEPVLAPPPAPAPAGPAAAAIAVLPPAPDLARGRFAVQVGVFLVEANAQTIAVNTRAKLAADTGLADSDKIVRTVKKGERTYVVVGDAPERSAAESLAQRLRSVLGQDVVVFQR